jgi:hypothetical protein
MPGRITDGQFRLLIYLADKANTEGEDIYPSLERLVRWSGFAPRYVARTIEDFRLRGWLRGYSRGGELRWRLELPVEIPTETVENFRQADRGSRFRDRGSLFDASSIHRSDDRSDAATAVTENAAGPPPFDPSLIPPDRPDLADIKATLANLKARLNVAPQQPAKRRGRAS